MPVIQIPRSHQLKVTLTPEMHTRLSGLAERFGQTPATLASVALGHYVTTQEATLGAPQKMVDSMLGQLMPQILAQLPDAVEINLPKLGPGWKETPDDNAGIDWWNALTEPERARWLRDAGTAVPAVAWEYSKRSSLENRGPTSVGVGS
jgi:hypothetical protein